MSEPTTAEEYNALYQQNFKTTGYGIEGVTNHFPCPFCAAPEWYVVRVIDFSPPLDQQGIWETEPIKCENCGRSAKHVSLREATGVRQTIVQTDGPDPAPWVPIGRKTNFESPASASVQGTMSGVQSSADDFRKAPAGYRPKPDAYGNEPTRKPDLGGIALGGSGRAWEIAHTDELVGQNVDWQAGIRSYLVHAPGAHPFWYWYVVGCVHLRDIPGQSKPARHDFPEATHEILFMALNPEEPLPDPDNYEGGRWLTPLDLEHQFQVNSDEEAAELTELVVRRICGGASPDQDFRSYWRGTINAMAEEIRLRDQSDQEE